MNQALVPFSIRAKPSVKGVALFTCNGGVALWALIMPTERYKCIANNIISGRRIRYMGAKIRTGS
jgi:hypothetical protein